jgi:hypothetical protein
MSKRVKINKNKKTPVNWGSQEVCPVVYAGEGGE